MIILTGKSEYLYDTIFEELKKIIFDNGVKLNEIPQLIMVDFEKSLINSVRKNFLDSKVDGCFYHFVKLLWSRAKALGLCQKNIFQGQGWN